MRIISKLENQRFGRWLVLEYAGYHKHKNHNCGYHLWKCLCDCGKTFNVREQLLKRGDSTQCKPCADSARGLKQIKRKIPSSMYNSIQKSYKNRGIESNISDIELYEIFQQQEGKCALTGVDIELVFSKNKGYSTASPDRINPSKGYTKNNIRWVHKMVNYIRRDLTDEEFKHWCNLVSRHTS